MDSRDQATAEVRDILERTARRQATIAYSEVTPQIRAFPLEPDSTLFAEILDEISAATDSDDRGMLSAVVIHKGDDYLPGKGFFKLAKRLGRQFSEKRAFHAAELSRVHAAYQRP